MQIRPASIARVRLGTLYQTCHNFFISRKGLSCRSPTSDSFNPNTPTLPTTIMASTRLRIDGTIFRDTRNREITLRGINCAGDAKFPLVPDVPSYVTEKFYEGDDVSFVGRPFTVKEAHHHFARLKRYGYNTIRYIFTWEAIEHAGPKKYDEEWIQHTVDVLRCAKEYGFYIFMDPHQDVWSRFSGGSGAPMWTLYACGLDPKSFVATEAALVHNAWPEGPENYPKMIWSTNYWRLTCWTMFTLFFAGKHFAPKCVIDGQNIQDYLQNHFIGACKHLAQRINEAGDLENDIIIGWESMNEPNKGLIGCPDLSITPPEQKLHKGTSPTPWQALLLGQGIACEVETWDVGGLGPYKNGTKLVDPKGTTAWLAADHDDTKYGWKRDPAWKLGECIWAQHGVWDTKTDQLLKKDYFHKNPENGEKMDYEYFTNHHFMDYYRRHKEAIRSVHKNCVLLCQPPVMEIPPSLKGTEDDDPSMIYAPHFYDGITLLNKSWNRWWNVDVFGVLRGRYLTPAFAVKIGETAIRNCLRDQLTAIKQEGLDYMGDHPCLFSEIGIPYDMDNKHAYKTGDYLSQVLAMDANHFALEGSGVAGFALWVYMTKNTHEWGDHWNGEDLSIFSVDDKPLPVAQSSHPRQPLAPESQISLNSSEPSYSKSRSETDANIPVDPTNIKEHIATPTISRTPSHLSTGGDLATSGYRAAEAYVRPSPIYTVGKLTSYVFDLRNATFNMELNCEKAPTDDSPTVIFLPEYHFPRKVTRVESSSGKWTIAIDEADCGLGLIQRLRWWHGTGQQKLTIVGVKRKVGANSEAQEDDDPGYIEQCQQQGNKCIAM